MKTFVFEIMQAVVPKISFQKCVSKFVFFECFATEKKIETIKVHFGYANCAARIEINI